VGAEVLAGGVGLGVQPGCTCVPTAPVCVGPKISFYKSAGCPAGTAVTFIPPTGQCGASGADNTLSVSASVPGNDPLPTCVQAAGPPPPPTYDSPVELCAIDKTGCDAGSFCAPAEGRACIYATGGPPACPSPYTQAATYVTGALSGCQCGGIASNCTGTVQLGGAACNAVSVTVGAAFPCMNQSIPAMVYAEYLPVDAGSCSDGVWGAQASDVVVCCIP
jgi:hypothetical protein